MAASEPVRPPAVLQFGWTDCPPAVREQVRRLEHLLTAVLGSSLLGIYLHGSLSMGCFNPQSSDIDLLVVAGDEMEREQKLRLAGALLAISGRPAPIEMHILLESELKPWKSPTPYHFHYSEGWRDRWQQIIRTPGVLDGALDGGFDLDLAAHVTHLHDRGVALIGPPIHQLFPQVPRQHFIAALMDDLRDAELHLAKNPVYTVLNLCRVYRYLRQGAISSKAEAGIWAGEFLLEERAEIARRALEIYCTGEASPPLTHDQLTRFKDSMLQEIRELRGKDM